MSRKKSSLRQSCLKSLKKISMQNRLYKSAVVNKKLLSVLKKIKNKKILFYYPLQMEVDILKVLHLLRKNNSIYLPFMEGQSFKMVPFRLPLQKKKFGIFEAADTNLDIKKIDIAIVPVVGVDGNLQRIGFGKGMYDRFFAQLNKKPYIIFTQLEYCKTQEFICDDYDISCNLLLTPKVTLYKKKKIRN